MLRKLPSAKSNAGALVLSTADSELLFMRAVQHSACRSIPRSEECWMTLGSAAHCPMCGNRARTWGKRTRARRSTPWRPCADGAQGPPAHIARTGAIAHCNQLAGEADQRKKRLKRVARAWGLFRERSLRRTRTLFRDDFAGEPFLRSRETRQFVVASAGRPGWSATVIAT